MGEAQGGGSRAKAEANHISGRPEENSGGAKSAVGESEARSLTARFPHVCASRSPLAVECEGLKLLRRLADQPQLARGDADGYSQTTHF